MTKKTKTIHFHHKLLLDYFFFLELKTHSDQLMTNLQQSQSHSMKMSPSSMHLSPTGTDNSTNDLLDDSPSKFTRKIGLR